jgi:hypothetical protein
LGDAVSTVEPVEYTELIEMGVNIAKGWQISSNALQKKFVAKDAKL